MRTSGWRRAAILGLSLCGAFAARAGEPDRSECHTDAILVVDASGSMASTDTSGNVSRIHRVREAAAKVVPSVAPLRNLGLMVYGGEGGTASSCTNIALKVRPAPDNTTPILEALRNVLPNGRTPLTESVSRAAEALHYRSKRATVVLLTDGEESCGGDPCRLADQLHREGVDTQVHVIDYKLRNGSDWRGTFQSRCLATATGGLYLPVNTTAELIAALRETLGCPYVTGLPRRLAGTTPPRASLIAQELSGGATGSLSRAGEGWGEGKDFSGKGVSLTLSLSRTGEGTPASVGSGAPGTMPASDGTPDRR